jgi:hypothetical protein
MTSVVGLTEILNINVTPTPGSVQDTNLTEIAGTAVATGTGASDAGTQRVVLSSDSQVAATQSGAWNVGTAESSTAITGTASANATLVTTQTLGYNSISVQLTGSWVAAVVFQASNDNVNWVNVQGYAFNSTMSAIDTAVDNDIYVFPVVGRYFQAVVMDYASGTVTATAYLRTQSLAGIGEASLTQAMDQANNTPMNVTFPGMTSTVGQQSTVTSLPVALATEQIQDKFIVGRAFQGAIPINTVLTNDPSAPNTNGWIDCLQYRSVAFHIVQIQSATGGILTFEVSNDGVNIYNNPVGFFDTQGVDSTTLGASASTSLSTTGAKTIVRVGNIAWRYFRIRVTTAVTGTPNLQAFVTLRMTASPYVNVPNANISDIGGRTIPFTTVLSPSNALGTTNNTTAFLPIGGTDDSLVNPQIQGAPYPVASTNAAYVAGPFYRRNYVDFTGGVGAVGPDPRYAEDKTYPVNVRLERTTAGQDSVQDLLQQILIELRANNHYTRETPAAVAALLQSPNLFNSSASMQDDPENFADDSTISRYQKGH